MAPRPVRTWCLSNFWVGQKLFQSAEDEQSAEHFCVRHRKLLSIIIPVVIVQIGWWIYALTTNSFYIFNEEINGVSRYYMAITMIFGSFIAGATSEGGASIAFPVMTIGFGILPSVARDFSFMIQSVGMSSAAFSILFMRLKVEYHSIIYCSIGGIIGIIICLQYISDLLPPSYSKMYYVSICFSFAFSLFLLNTTRDRIVFDIIPKWENGVIFSYKYFTINWKAIVLLLCGFIGGIFSGIAGSGIDICSFAILTLLFRVSEKTATPTSVVLMAINTLIGFGWRGIVQQEISPASYEYFFVCIPIVVIGAPIGSIVASYLHRRVFANFIYVATTSQLIGAFTIVKPWNISLFLTISSLVIIVIGGIIFGVIRRIGLIFINTVEIKAMNKISHNTDDVVVITQETTEQHPLLS